MATELRSEYDKRRRLQIKIDLSPKEASILDKMMREGDWDNRSGFIKYKLFGESADRKFSRMVHYAKYDDVISIVKNAVIEMNDNLGYLNYKFDYQLRRLEQDKGLPSDKQIVKRLSHLIKYKNKVREKIEEMYFLLESLLANQNIQIQELKLEDVRYMSDEALEKAAKDWNDLTSPEAKEAARRIYEKYMK